MTILVIAEHDNHTLKPSTLSVVSAAGKLGGEIHILVAGGNCAAVAGSAKTIEGVTKILLADDAAYAEFLAENLTPLIVEIAKGYSHILAPATTFGKDFMPRVAALLDVAQISDVIEIINSDTFKRPIYAGNAIATVHSKDNIKVMTLRTTTFAKAKTGAGTAGIENVAGKGDSSISRFVNREVAQSSRPELTAAKIVVSGGRGLGSAANFAMIERIADKLGAAVGASRAAVDAGYVPNDYQVGQTGKIVAPDLYIAIGISGAIQHLAGMKESKIVVAINKDENAPIFEVADYGLVMDLFQALPELEKALG